MTPKARRQQQLTRESATRNQTEAAIAVFKTAQRISRPTRLVSSRRTRKQAARCYGCDVNGFPLSVWEYDEVESGPAILCDACATLAEATLRASRTAGVKSVGQRPTGRVIQHRGRDGRK